MPAIGATTLSLDTQSTQSTTRVSIGSASLTNNTTHLVLAIANYRINGTANETPTLEIECGGTIYTWGSENSIPVGGAAPQALGAGQLTGAWLFTSGTSQTIEAFLRTSNGGGGGTAAHTHSFRAIAIELTNIPGSGTGTLQRRWHAETANDDTIVTTPANGSGLVNVGDPLTFTPNRSGTYLLFASCEIVKNNTTAALEQSFAVTQDGTLLSGTKHYKECDSQPNGDVATVSVFGYPLSLTAGVSTTLRIQGNGTAGAGEFGYRRIRLHCIEAAAFAEAYTDTDTAGFTCNNSPTTADSTVAITVNGHASSRYVFFGGAQGQHTSYGDLRYNQSTEGTNYPTDGANRHSNDLGVAAGDDICLITVLDSAVITASRTLTLRANKRAGTGNNTYGNHCGRSADRGTAWGSIILLQSTVIGEIDATLPIIGGDATGTVGSGGSTLTSEMAANLPLSTMDATGLVAHRGVLAASLLAPIMAASGQAQHVSALDSDLPLPVADFSGSHAHISAFDADLPVPTMDGTGLVYEVIGSILDTALPLPTIDAAGIVATHGVLASSLPMPAMDGAGVASTAIPGVLGSRLPVVTMDAEGTAIGTLTGAFASVLPLPVAAFGGHTGVQLDHPFTASHTRNRRSVVHGDNVRSVTHTRNKRTATHGD